MPYINSSRFRAIFVIVWSQIYPERCYYLLLYRFIRGTWTNHTCIVLFTYSLKF